MRVGLVVQRYGEEVVGGAESLCRTVAERLARHISLEVLTTTALDHTRWAPHYPAGRELVNNVQVRRFPIARRRNPTAFHRLSERLFQQPHTIEDEIAWMEAQGPQSSALVEALVAEQDRYDALAFFTYLYYPTYFGLQVAPHKSVLIPTAHDEPAIHLDIFNTLFRSPAGMVFLTDAERRFVQSRFHVEHIPFVVAGAGVEIDSNPDADRFRQRYGLEGPFLLYAGRIEQAKGCDQLIDYFLRFRDESGLDVKLVLIGQTSMSLPDDPSVRALGFLDQAEKTDALAAADLVVMPSRFESLSIVSLEAWAVGTPILVNGRSEVLRDHCLTGNGGLYYLGFAEFSEAIQLLLGQPRLRIAMGEAGRKYVEANYQWGPIERAYLGLFEHISGIGLTGCTSR